MGCGLGCRPAKLMVGLESRTFFFERGGLGRVGVIYDEVGWGRVRGKLRFNM